MANRSLGSLTLNLVAEIGGYVGPLSKAERATAASAARMKKDIEQVAKAGTLFAVGVGTAFAALVKHSINLQDEMSKASQKVGVSVENLSKLNYAADLSGVAFESLVSGLGKFNKNLAEAFTSGTGAAAESLADLGVEIKDSNGRLKDTNSVFLEVAERLSGLEDGATKTAISMNLFGKSGADLIPLLNSGKVGLADMATEAEKLGQVLDADTAKKAEEFNDNLTRLQKTFTGVANAVAMEALPELTAFSEKIKDPAFQDGIASLAKGLVTVTASIASAASSLGNFVTDVAEGLSSSINGIAADDIPRLTKRLEELNKALAPQDSGNNILTGVNVKDVLKSTEALEKERATVQQWLEVDKQYQASLAETARVRKAASEVGEDPFGLTPQQRAAEIEYNRKKREDAEKAAKDREKAAEQTKKQVEQLQQAFTSQLETLQREIALYGEVTQAQTIRYDTEKGNLKDLDADHKKELIYFATLADLREKDAKAIEKQKEAKQKQDDQVKNIDEMIKQQERSIALAGTSSKYAQTEYDIRNGILEVVGGINSQQAKTLLNQAKILDSQESFQEASKLSAKAFERIEEAGADIWLNMEDGFNNFRDTVIGSFKRMLAEMAHQAVTKPILLQFQQVISGATGQAGGGVGGIVSGASQGASALGATGGLYAAGALATLAAIDKWNAQQDAKFVKLTAEYKQANQSLSAVLGEGNRKAQSIATGIETLTKSDGNLLDVNNKMLVSLEGIRAGITDVAAGFAKTLVGSNDYEALGIKQGTSTSGAIDNILGGFGAAKTASALLGDTVGGFLGGLANSVSKAIYSKKKKVIDSGIQIIGTTLADILTGASIEAFNYADVKTTKKIFGITSSTKVNRTKEDLSNVFEEQITGVFKDAADALKDASGAFGIDFASAAGDLKIDTQDISLKGLEGEALTKELESFFSKTLDDWAGALLGAGNTRILEDFQQVGESAFETMLRLAGETRTFSKYAEVLNLNFKATGLNAVYATQAIADAAGGFDKLSGSLATYYDKFFTESDKFAQNQKALTDAFKQLNVSLPESRDGFKQLISGLDLTNAADQERFAQLVKLAGATDEYFSALEKETDAKKAAAKQALDDAEAARQLLKDSAGKAFNSLTKAVDKQKDAVQKQIDAANNALNSTRAVTDSLNAALKSMTLQSSKNELAVRRQAQAQIIAANAIAKAGGPLPKAGQLDDALSLLTQPSQDLYASFEDYARDFYTTSKNIKELADATGEQQTFEEQNLEVLTSQLTALDDMVKFYQTQIDKLDDVNTSVLSVRTAIDQLNNTLAEAGISVTPSTSVPELSYTYEQAQVTQSRDYVATTPTLTTTSVNELTLTVAALAEQLEASQFAIAKNTLNTAKILQRWESDGMPSETSSV